MRLYLMMKDFLEKEDYCSIDYFVQKYEVSKRTIQNDISYLMRISTRKGFQLHMKRGLGYLLEVSNEQLFEDFLESLNEGVSFPTKERAEQILSYLVIQDGYVSMDKVAETFQVSKTLIKSEIKDVVDLAHSFHFEIERRSHYGIRVIGNNICLKVYLVDEYLNQNVFIQTAVNDVVADFSKVENELISRLDQEGLNINYNELLNVIEYLKVMVFWSYKNGEKNEIFVFETDKAIHRIAEYMCRLLVSLYDVKFSSESIEELLKVLNKNVRKEIENISSMHDLENDIKLFLKKTDETYQTGFLKDDVFKTMLLTHVRLLVDRLHNKISYKNALANEISITNPMIFNIAIQFCDMLKEKYNVESTFDEIGFVAMHFAGHMEKEKQLKLQLYNRIGVVCSSGGGSAYMIKLQIESLFPNARVQTFSFLQQKELLLYQPDLIFTVMPLSLDVHVPIIYIKELLDDRDLYRIKQILQCEEYDPYTLVNENPLYYSFFSKEFFKIIQGNNYHEIIQQMAYELEEKGYGKKGYAHLVLERESYISTVYMNGVCIPHPLETDALKSVISVCLLDQPFIWNDKEVKIIFMICLKKEQIEVYKSITKALYQFMRDTKYINRILQVRSFEELMAVIKEVGGIQHE